MENWLIYGLATSLFFGVFAISNKVATSEKYYGLNPSAASIFMGIGILAVFVGFALYGGNFAMPKSIPGAGYGLLSGIMWGAGMVFVLKALSSGADVAKLVPIYNTNTLVAVILGIVLLKEIPVASAILKVLAGAILILIGSVLVSF